MTLSVLVCVFCCPLLIGIFAILKSSEARNRYAAGDYAGAVASARRARNLAFVAVVCGLILILIFAIALSV
ncbi:CD225 dispanin family [Paramuricea clavata]|uniref:CD225 dispanin family n=2 Tax=Paramuricea clavata TaxID=317549 RepID=A0A6S7K7I7_PARCT|nr:CD225 dispanin family [Paramuricea clavata]